MNLYDAVGSLEGDHLWAFAARATRAAHPRLELGPHATEAAADILDLITNNVRDPQTVRSTADAFRDAIRRDEANEPIAGARFQKQRSWGDILLSGLTSPTASTAGALARRAGDTEDDQWAHIADLTGIDDDLAATWVAIAGDWGGTSDELIDAVRGARAICVQPAMHTSS